MSMSQLTVSGDNEQIVSKDTLFLSTRIFALIRSRIVTTMDYMYYNVYFSSIFCDIFRVMMNDKMYVLEMH